MATPVLPKLLTLTAPTIRNQRTLIWLQKQANTVNWSKWDCVVSNLQDYNYWSQQRTKIVGITITDVEGSDTDSFLTQLYEVSKKVPLILLSQKILALKSEDYWSENFDNVLNLSNLTEQYPFIEQPWNNTVEDAIAVFGLLCRYNRIVDCSPSESR